MIASRAGTEIGLAWTCRATLPRDNLISERGPSLRRAKCQASSLSPVNPLLHEHELAYTCGLEAADYRRVHEVLARRAAENLLTMPLCRVAETRDGDVDIRGVERRRGLVV